MGGYWFGVVEEDCLPSPSNPLSNGRLIWTTDALYTEYTQGGKEECAVATTVLMVVCILVALDVGPADIPGDSHISVES